MTPVPPPPTPDWTSFLHRTPHPLDTLALAPRLHRKTILITGAGGFLGSALARALCSFSPARLILLDLAEHGLHQLDLDLGLDLHATPRTLVLGDICDPALLHDLFTRHHPDIVFHAAAAKHVPLLETNPLAAARTNILGTHAVLQAANTARTPHFVLLSTDKAVQPTSIMGATKRIAELLVITNAQSHSRPTPGPTRAAAVRLGNILGSTGSVVPLFQQQIARGLPLTLTHPACTRYFLSLQEAVEALLSALLLNEFDPAPLLIARAGPPRLIADLAAFLLQHAGLDPRQTTPTPLRPGEKLTESMTAPDEHTHDLPIPQLQRVTTPLPLHLPIHRIEAAVHARSIPALLQAIAAILPAYQPSPTLLAEAEAPSPVIVK